MEKVKPNIAYTLRHQLCTGCGVCEDACPSKAIQIVVHQGKFEPKVNEKLCGNSKGCHRCYDTCAGLGINLVGMAKSYFTDDGIKEDKMVGRYLRCFSGYSNDYDIRYHSASGGMVSQFLIWLLENDKIDGAVVTKFDRDNPLMVKTFIATSREEVILARSSKYAPVSLNHASRDIKAASGHRYVVVGIPCHIQGFRKLMETDKRLREKVIGLFAIYCSSGRTFNLTEHVMKERKIQRENLSYFAYRDNGCLGNMKAICNGEVYEERYQSYYHPLRSFFIPRRCLFCIDHYGELGDICFGDLHIEPYIRDKIGVNSLVVRKRMWLDYLSEAQNEGYITLTEIPFETVSASQKMSFKKKGRNGTFIHIGEKMGWIVPKYDVDYLRRPTIHDWLDYAQNRMQQFLGNHKSLWWLVSLLKKDTSHYE